MLLILWAGNIEFRLQENFPKCFTMTQRSNIAVPICDNHTLCFSLPYVRSTVRLLIWTGQQSEWKTWLLLGPPAPVPALYWASLLPSLQPRLRFPPWLSLHS